MNKLTITTAAFLFSLVSIAQNRSIAFEHGTFKEIKEKAAKENKLIFIDAYTSWCGPCKWMAANIFTNDTVADYYNKNFVNAKIDMEKGEGIEIAKQYQVSCYPNNLFIDGKGNLVHRTAGSMTAKDFIVLGETAKDDKTNFKAIVANYKAKSKDPDAIIKYVRAMGGTCLDAGTAANDYFALQKDEDLTSPQNWDMIHDFTKSMDSREFKYLVANREKFEALYTEKKVTAMIGNIVQNNLMNATRQKDETKYNELKKKVESMNLKDGKQILFESDLTYASNKKDWEAYSKLAVANVDQYYLNNAYMLNSIAWTFYESVNNKEGLAKAEEWAKKATELGMNYANLDTYAAILYKNGKKELAELNATKAIRYGKSEKADYSSTEQLMEKIKAMK